MKASASPSFLTVLICTVFLLFAGCQDEGAGDIPSGDPVITPIGTPVGESISATIGENGGTLVSADEKISLTIPAGALSGATEITIQPVTGEAPLGLGQGYRLLPHGLNFSKPVKLKFSYDSQLLKSTPEEFLWIVTQAADGSWNALLKSAVDRTMKSVSCETTHFSDWALGRFVDLTITPVSPIVKKGESVKLELTGFLRDLPSDDDDLAPLLPITSDGDVLAPLTPIPPVESRIMQFKVKRWSMNGSPAPVSNENGSLSAKDNSATYKAPNETPDTNPVAVSATLETTNKEGKKSSYELVSNIRVEEDLSLTLIVDGKTYLYYQHGIDGVYPPDDPENPGNNVRCVFEDGALVIYAGDDIHTIFVGGVENPSTGTRVFDCKTYDDKMVFGYDDANYFNTYYKRTRDTQGGCKSENTCGEMSFTLTSFDETFGSIVTGTFSGSLYEEKSEFWDSCTTSVSHSIQGKFTLMIHN